MSKTKTHTEFVQKVYELEGNEYIVVGPYEKARKKILMQHITCNQVFQVTPSHFLGGTRCPYCNESKGERIIKEYLEKRNIIFKKEFSFPDCKYITLLKFDFAVFDINSSVIALIEYDGEQHFRPIPYFGGKEKYKQTITRDKIKDKYCYENNIKLIRVPYYEKDIISVLNFHLNPLLNKKDIYSI